MKYAVFIWGAYGASAVALAGMAIDTLLRGRVARRAVERLERQAPDE
jgi:heme exporter protein CcmD